jgi:hypothetical protein
VGPSISSPGSLTFCNNGSRRERLCARRPRQRTTGTPGLKGLKSEIRVQGVSSFDDRLRRELVRKIYGDERFVQYASWVHPPIRIIVDKGRITLTGVVGSAVEQQLVGHIAAEPVHKAVIES